jgi:DNA replication licensing factor MCM3
LVFVVLDKTDDEFNKAISEHITRVHRFVLAGAEEGVPMTEALVAQLAEASIKDDEDDETPVFQKYNELLHIGVRPKKRNGDVEILSIPFLKKYIFYAKNRIKPALTQEACDYISNKYAELRSKADGKDDKYKVF